MSRRRAPEPLHTVQLSERALVELAKAAQGHALTIEGLRLDLPPKSLRELGAASRLHGITPAELAAIVINHYLRVRRPHKLLTGQPAELDVIAMQRKRVVEAWQQSRSRAGKGQHGRATDRFLVRVHRVEGIKLSRATLFNWARAYATGGLVALVDLRNGKAHARPLQAAAERTSKRVTSPSNGRSKGL